MGCASSKETLCQNCRNCRHNPARRSYSPSDVHHPPQRAGDSYHIVALKSSTLGSLRLDPSINSRILKDADKGEPSTDQNRAAACNKPPIFENGENAFAMRAIEGRAWSEMIDAKIPKTAPTTPARTPPDEPPETINAWEMMEGLEDISPLRPKPHARTSSFHFLPNEDCPPGINGQEKDPCKNSKKTKDRLIVYFTSLRSVRKTYEDCCHVRAILKGLGVRVDERDVSMHSGFKDELKEMLGEGFSLPRVVVVVGSKCIAYGADEIRRLDEEGRLGKMAEGCEPVGCCLGNRNVCAACGDVRFVPCERCSGSCKVYFEKEYEDEDGEEEEEEFDESCEEYGFKRCPDCNENGLVRCSVCCD